MKSDYDWIWSGELLRFAMITAIGTATLLAGTWLNAGSVGLEDGWWVAPTSAAGLAVLDYIRGRLPAPLS